MKFISGNYLNRPIIAIYSQEDSSKAFDLTAAALQLNLDFPSSLLEGIQLGDKFLQRIEEIKALSSDQRESFLVEMESIELSAPIPRPLKNIFCVGKNYRDHALELGSEADIPDAPMFFSKTPTTVIGANEHVLIPSAVSTDIDYEGELAVVIGKSGKGITQAAAYDHVFGYTIVNDITARDLQSKHKQFLIGKSMDNSCPMGPVLVHKSSIPDPHDLHIKTYVNDELRQSSSTSKMIFHIPELIEVLSKVMTLEAGDIIATGTPAGVGKGFKPPKYLKAKDVVKIEIENIGVLSNPVYEDV